LKSSIQADENKGRDYNFVAPKEQAVGRISQAKELLFDAALESVHEREPPTRKTYGNIGKLSGERTETPVFYMGVVCPFL
jgi:hypothetical protein